MGRPLGLRTTAKSLWVPRRGIFSASARHGKRQPTLHLRREPFTFSTYWSNKEQRARRQSIFRQHVASGRARKLAQKAEAYAPPSPTQSLTQPRDAEDSRNWSSNSQLAALQLRNNPKPPRSTSRQRQDAIRAWSEPRRGPICHDSRPTRAAELPARGCQSRTQPQHAFPGQQWGASTHICTESRR